MIRTVRYALGGNVSRLASIMRMAPKSRREVLRWETHPARMSGPVYTCLELLLYLSEIGRLDSYLAWRAEREAEGSSYTPREDSVKDEAKPDPLQAPDS